MTKVNTLRVLLHGELIGTLSHLPGDKNFFSFSTEYINRQDRPTVSLSFKDRFGELITDPQWTQTRLPPFFSNLLPEGYMREYLAKRVGVNDEHEFFLLAALGRDLPGALQVCADHEIPPRQSREIINNTTKSPLQFSLAGIQVKFSATKTTDKRWTIPVNGVGGSWIIKLPSNNYRGVPENEYSMMELARRIGIDVPETALISLQQIRGIPEEMGSMGPSAFVIKRFDRGGGGKLIHTEDFAQIFGVYPEKKYRAASYRNIAEVVWLETGEKGIAEWIRRLVFSILIGNGDMHLKNWSLIYPNQRTAALAPAYDLVSTIPYLPNESLALNFLDSKAFDAVTLAQFKRFAIKTQLPENLVLQTVQQTIQSFADAWHSMTDLPIEGSLKQAIEAHLTTLPLWKSIAND